jgi:hypothetical protein
MEPFVANLMTCYCVRAYIDSISPLLHAAALWLLNPDAWDVAVLELENSLSRAITLAQEAQLAPKVFQLRQAKEQFRAAARADVKKRADLNFSVHNQQERLAQAQQYKPGGQYGHAVARMAPRHLAISNHSQVVRSKLFSRWSLVFQLPFCKDASKTKSGIVLHCRSCIGCHITHAAARVSTIHVTGSVCAAVA